MLGEVWQRTKDGDRAAFALFRRHYSFKQSRKARAANCRRFVGPGARIVLVTADYSALFVWRVFRSMDGQAGVNCAVFRNESQHLSSALILAAERFAWERWPGARLYTYVDPRKVRSANPGFCFLAAGWRRCGVTKCRQLLIFEKLPAGEPL